MKVHPDPFGCVLRGTKTFEYRLNDRGFELGDRLVLLEWSGDYTGRSVVADVTYILSDGFGLPPGYCVMSIRRV